MLCMRALYQGTTSVVPKCIRIIWALAPGKATTTYPGPPLPLHKSRAFVPEFRFDPGFDVVVTHFDASAVVHTRSSSRRTPDPLIAGLFPSRFPPRLLTDMTLRRFGLPACTASP